MPRIEWHDDLSCGCPIIDDDHKILVRQIDRLATAITEGAGPSVADGVLAILLDYTAFHFDREEVIMTHTRFPGAARHAKEHEVLLQKLYRMNADWRTGAITERMLLGFLIDWLTGHILGPDKSVGDHARERGYDHVVPALPAHKNIDWSKLSVLLVDDTTDFRRLLRGALNNLGIRDISEAKSGAKALELMRSKDFDVVLVDDEMPIMTGVDLVREVRRAKKHPDPRTCMILVSSQSMSREFLRDATLAGMHDVLCMPLTADRLKVRLRRHLTHPPAFQCVDGGLAPVRSTA